MAGGFFSISICMYLFTYSLKKYHPPAKQERLNALTERNGPTLQLVSLTRLFAHISKSLKMRGLDVPRHDKQRPFARHLLCEAPSPRHVRSAQVCLSMFEHVQFRHGSGNEQTALQPARALGHLCFMSVSVPWQPCDIVWQRYPIRPHLRTMESMEDPVPCPQPIQPLPLPALPWSKSSLPRHRLEGIEGHTNIIPGGCLPGHGIRFVEEKD